MSDVNPKNKRVWQQNIVLVALLVVMLVPIIFLTVHTVRDDAQSWWTLPVGQTFTGEMQQGDGDWIPYTEGTVNALKGDLKLRGQLSKPQSDAYLCVYLDHI